ncbi:hypothetical protein ACJX0J_028701, partial [Zea mays]
ILRAVSLMIISLELKNHHVSLELKNHHVCCFCFPEISCHTLIASIMLNIYNMQIFIYFTFIITLSLTFI